MLCLSAVQPRTLGAFEALVAPAGAHVPMEDAAMRGFDDQLSITLVVLQQPS